MSDMAIPILLVEDNSDDVLLIRRAFRATKIANPLHVVDDGEKAVAYLAGTGEYADRSRYPMPGLVILDIKLPRKSGLEILAWLRNEPILKRLRVVMLTSSKEPEDINGAYELGVNSYLTKPVSFESLIEMTRALDLYWLVLSERPEVHHE